MKVGLFLVCGRNFVILPQKSVPSLLNNREKTYFCEWTTVQIVLLPRVKARRLYKQWMTGRFLDILHPFFQNHFAYRDICSFGIQIKRKMAYLAMRFVQINGRNKFIFAS